MASLFAFDPFSENGKPLKRMFSSDRQSNKTDHLLSKLKLNKFKHGIKYKTSAQTNNFTQY